MDESSTVELVLLDGGRAGDAPAASGDPARPPPDLRVVRPPPSELQAAIEETVAAARRIRRDIEARIAGALDDLLRTRAPEPDPR